MDKLSPCRISLILALLFVWCWGEAAACPNTIHSTCVTRSPIVDGRLEETWRQADSISAFIQLRPDQGEPISEPTTIWVLQDDQAIYFAFRCETPNRRPDCRITGRDAQEGDFVVVYLDTFKDKRNAYFFGVSAAGVQSDGRISQDGGYFDYSWDGVFYSKVMVSSRGYSVEMKIPWRQLRYNPNSSEWGVNLQRSIPRNGEEGYFAPLKLEEGFRISRFGSLDGIEPSTPGRGIELFPRSLFRYEKSYGEKESRFRLCGDLNWAVKPWLRLQVTSFPDFSQIEADPFALNLSKYELYFEERRPFFVEGAEYFEPPGGLMAQPLSLFYSRQVGRKLWEGSEVPVQVASRLTGNRGRMEFGVLLAVTGSKKHQSIWGLAEEKRASFSVNRLKFQLLSNFTLGLFHAGKYGAKSHNDVFSLDGAFLSPKIRWSYQIAQSNKDGRRDLAYSSSLLWMSPKFFFNATAQKIGDSFDVSEIGFVPWIGYRSVSFSLGPSFYPRRGAFVNWGLRLNGTISRELAERLYSRIYGISVEAYTRNNWGLSAGFDLGRQYELDGSYNPKSFHLSLLTDPTRALLFNLSLSSSYGYNYRRFYFARDAYVYSYLYLHPSRRWSFSLMANHWIEFDPERELEEMTTRLRPGIRFAMTKDMSLGVYEETVISNKIGAFSYRIGISFSYNFLPKSWLYAAINDLEYKKDGSLSSMERIVALKIKHLFFW